jgi:hypothetical protein
VADLQVLFVSEQVQVQHFIDGFHGVPPCLWQPALHSPRRLVYPI